MLTLLRDADVYAPEARGPCDILVAAGVIVAVAPHLPALPAELGAIEVELRGARVVPGLIDAHAHVTGGGGESGPASRVPPLSLSSITTGGVTTCVGVLGTDGTTRTVASLVARTLGLREEGLSAWCYTGSYELPLRTLTGSVRSDIAFVEPIVGVGELALSDHRSSQPTLDELLRIASDAHVAGMMSDKAGIVHLHLGDGPRGLDLVRRALAVSELPPRVFHPTHVNRQKRLFDEARELAQAGATIDVTAFPVDDGDPGLSAADAIGAYLDAGLPSGRLTCSSDAGGCLPTFDTDGRIAEMDVGRSSALADTLRELVRRGRALSSVLPVFTTNVASVLRLRKKGAIAPGMDADLVVLDAEARVRDVMARGEWMVRDGRVTVPGRFERRTTA